ncbi:LytR C-terminal domain-containing protein [Streptomyces sp. KR80]|uniref:LytR C-terminal domain-containing protein n=1 Tax=Streptomyces sp. KR80 TaxID=3457426 RepID=UPI003FD40C37
MSMLTPPGMGGKYRITGDRYPRMRRPRNRRRILLGVIGTVAALGLVGWGTMQLIDVFSGSGGRKVRAAGKADCKRQSGPRPSGLPLPKPGDITVNVYNATPRSGLAKETADELKKRGFKIGKIGNATPEYDKKIKGAGVLLGAPNSVDGRIKVLGTQLAGAETKADELRKGEDVDLIIGDAFKALTDEKDADQALASLSSPSPTPSGTRTC